MDNGFVTEILNKRGVTIREAFEGGIQERKLAQKYRNYSNNIASQFPKTSKALLTVAEHYKRDAGAMDQEAERRDLEY